jgi:Phosphoglucomutase/phosphomannomutase, alpha/beta/alpha domain III
VDFNQIAEWIIEDELATGGEENAGWSIGHQLLEKNGIPRKLLCAEAVARTGTSLLSNCRRSVTKLVPSPRIGRTSD